ncbi:MAG: ribosome silencing factor [Eubacterium sp.]|nr:ribosome silencing factor [Eubacterium sp.]
MEEKISMLQVAVAALQDKKGESIVQLHVGERSVIADDFLIVSGSSRSQMDALMDGVEEAMGKAGYRMRDREGSSDGGWILLDYNDLIVHIFLREMREFYDLEHTWRDVSRTAY